VLITPFRQANRGDSTDSVGCFGHSKTPTSALAAQVVVIACFPALLCRI